MPIPGLIPFLTAAFGLGLFHALDTDHVIAVSGLGGTRSKVQRLWVLCSQWALGHGLTLLIVGIGVLLLGLAVPYELSQCAEVFVGFLLVGIGFWALFELFRNGGRTIFLKGIVRGRWEFPDITLWTLNSHQGNHSAKAVFVGMIHGLAGSAPLLALLPLTHQSSPWTGLAYLAFFSFGVLVSMIIFGGVFGVVMDWVHQRMMIMALGLRILIALVAIGLGGFWIYDHL